MQILNFFKSFVSPLRMVKFRYMSVLISICIFILSSYLLAIPRSVYLNNNIDKLVQEENYYYLHGLTEMPSADTVINQQIEEINAIPFEYSDYILTYDGFTNEAGESVKHKQYVMTYQNDKGRTVNITLVFDMSETIEGAYDFNKAFTYPEEGASEKFPDIANTEYYLIVFTTDRIIYLANPINIAAYEIKHDDQYLSNMSTISYYSTSNFNIDSIGTTGDEFGFYLSQHIANGFVNADTTYFSLVICILCIIFPLIIVTVFWLCCKKNGRLKTFKEYYNIGAICSIIPILIAFIIGWIWPLSDVMVTSFVMLYSLYFLFMLYKINSTMDLM